MFFRILISLCLLASISLIWQSNAFSVRPRIQGKSFLIALGASSVTGAARTGWMTLASSRGSSSPGYDFMKSPVKNKGSSFTESERNSLGIRGLVPAGDPISLETKVVLAMEQLRKKTSPLEKYIFLHTLQDADETLYFAVLTKNTEEVMPFVYTPTVGAACQEWDKITRYTPRGLYISSKDAGHVRKILDNWPQSDVKVIVVTDGERILGLGDLGANGMGIPVGKLALYTACAGINPAQCLPVHIDVGTNRPELRNSPTYQGLRQERDRSPAYDALIKEFFDACQDKYGREVLIQFEDFGNSNAFRLLENFQHRATCFNDDIQGTASVVLAGIISSLPLAKKNQVSDHTFLFYGAGEAGVGIANLVASAIQKETGCSEEEAKKKIWLVDSQGLVSSSRPDKLAHHKEPYAHKLPGGAAASSGDILLDAVKLVKPTALIGVSAQGASFTQPVCEEMAALNDAPLIFALSNPTSKAECTAEQAYKFTNGRAVFASGSPFDPVTLSDGRHFVPGQGNNAYIFPGVGLGALVAGAKTITDEDLYVAAVQLAKLVSPERLKKGCAYPPLSDIREVSLQIAAAVAKNICTSGRGKPESEFSGKGFYQACKDASYTPHY